MAITGSGGWLTQIYRHIVRRDRLVRSMAAVDADHFLPPRDPLADRAWANVRDIPRPAGERRLVVALLHDDAGEIVAWHRFGPPLAPGRVYDLDLSRGRWGDGADDEAAVEPAG